MGNKVKLEFRDFVNEEIIPEMLSSGFTIEELMDEEVELEKMQSPEMFNGEIMNNYQLITRDFTFDCYRDDELIKKFDGKPMKFSEFMKQLEF